MREPRQERPLAAEALASRVIEPRQVEELESDVAFEPAIAARRQPDGAHAARTERADQGISTDAAARHRRGGREWRRFEEIRRRYAIVLRKEPLEGVGD